MDLFDFFKDTAIRTRFIENIVLISDDKSKPERKELIIIDATRESGHKSSVKVTAHPVEKSTDVTDHIKMEPINLSIDGRIVREPTYVESVLSRATVASVGVGTAGSSLSPITSTFVSKMGGLLTEAVLESPGGNRIRDVFELLLSMQQEGKVFTAVTRLRAYPNMVLQNLQVPDSFEHGDGLDFTAELVEVRIVETETAEIAERKIDPKNKHSKTKKEEEATQKTEEIPSKTKAVLESKRSAFHALIY